MKATMIRKFNFVISLWLIVLTGCFCLFAYKLEINGLYIAALVVAGLLLASNAINLVSGIIASRPKVAQTKKEYN